MNSAVLISGEDTFARFQFDVFAFASSDEVWLHCRAEVCYNNDAFSCRKVTDELQSSKTLKNTF